LTASGRDAIGTAPGSAGRPALVVNAVVARRWI
jgi:hypothetical protein